MIGRKRSRPTVLNNFRFQSLKHEIISGAEQRQAGEIRLYSTNWMLMWRMCGKPPIVDFQDHESFLYEQRRYVHIKSEIDPTIVWDTTLEEDEDDAQ